MKLEGLYYFEKQWLNGNRLPIQRTDTGYTYSIYMYICIFIVLICIYMYTYKHVHL